MYIVSSLTFNMRRNKKGKFSLCCQHKMAGNTFQNIRYTNSYWNFGSLSFPFFLWSMCWTNWITGSLSLVILCWQTNILPLGRILPASSSSRRKGKNEMKHICTILYLFVWGLLNNSNHLMCENNAQCFETNLECGWFLFSMDSVNFFNS